MQNSANPQTSGPAPEGGYESRDASLKGILIFVAILIATFVFVQITVSLFFRHFSHRAAGRDERARENYVVPFVAASRAYFPQPREQVFPAADLQTFRAQEDAALNSYSWVDRKTGIVGIPIDRAMDLIIQRGLPVRAGTNENKTGPSSLQLQQQRPLQSTPPSKEEEK